MDLEEQPRGRTGRPRGRDKALGIKAVENALEVLMRIAVGQEPASLTALARDSEMEPSKMHHYLTSLCAKGFVEQNREDGLYDLGPTALELASLALARLDEMGFVRKAVDQLSRDIDGAAFVYIWSANGPVLIHVRHPPYSLINLKIGSVGPLIDTATGTIFIAYLPKSVSEPIFTKEARQRGFNVDGEWERVCARVEQVRSDRAYWSDLTIIPDTSACAAPVFNMQGELLCVIGASFFRRQIDDDAERAPLIERVRRCGADTSKRIGGVGPRLHASSDP